MCKRNTTKMHSNLKQAQLLLVSSLGTLVYNFVALTKQKNNKQHISQFFRLKLLLL